jgi:hypothetical protein
MASSPLSTVLKTFGLASSVFSANTQCHIHCVSAPRLHQLMIDFTSNQDPEPVMQGSVLTTEVA